MIKVKTNYGNEYKITNFSMGRIQIWLFIKKRSSILMIFKIEFRHIFFIKKYQNILVTFKLKNSFFYH